MGAAGGGGRLPTLRAMAVGAAALCALPVVVSLVLLWLPLLCCVVAAVRFRRVRMGTCRAGSGGGGGGRPAEKGDAADRVMLLQKYLEDQMELVGAEAGEFFDPREA